MRRVPRVTSTVATRAAAAIELGLEDIAGGERVGVGLELEDVGLEQDGLEQLVDADLRVLAEMLTNMFCPPHSSGHDAVGRRAPGARLSGLARGLVDLVDGHDDGHAGGAWRG